MPEWSQRVCPKERQQNPKETINKPSSREANRTPCSPNHEWNRLPAHSWRELEKMDNCGGTGYNVHMDTCIQELPCGEEGFEMGTVELPWPQKQPHARCQRFAQL